MDTTQKINTVEWFFGYGGNHIGLKRVIPNLCLRAVCEIEEYAIENILAKMEAGLLEAAPIWSNCKTFPTEPFVDRIDLFIASYPCQPFSSAGKRQGENDERHLWPHVHMWIRATRPLCVFLENVEGHVSMGLSTVISDLEEAGYKTSWGIFSARECLDGNHETAPHQRKRVFIMAHRNDEGFPRHWGLEHVGLSKRREVTKGCFAESGGLGSQGILWPSRPGEPQHAWEPPRVTNGELADTYQSRRETRRDHSITIDRRSRSHRSASHCCDKRGTGELAYTNSSEQGSQRGNNGEVLEVSSEQRADQCSTLSGGESSAMENTHGSRGEEPEHQQANLPSEPSGSDTEAMGDSECIRLEHRREHESMGEASGETEGGWSEPTSSPQEPNDSREGEASGNIESQYSEVESSLGRDIDGTTDGMDISELSGISNSELVEISDWMVKGQSRVDELRLLGNGVFPSTAEKAFRVLFKELTENK